MSQFFEGRLHMTGHIVTKTKIQHMRQTYKAVQVTKAGYQLLDNLVKC